MTNTTYPVYGINDEEEITFYDIEKLVKKMNQNNKNKIWYNKCNNRKKNMWE